MRRRLDALDLLRGKADSDQARSAPRRARTAERECPVVIARTHADARAAAIETLKQAIALDGSSAEAHNLLGVLHEMRHEHDASYREYKAALRADADHEPARNNMLRYYERGDRYGFWAAIEKASGDFGPSTKPIAT